MKRREEEGVVQPSRRYEKKGDVFFALMYKIKSVSDTGFLFNLSPFYAKTEIHIINVRKVQINDIYQDKTVLKKQTIFLSLSLGSAFSKYKR